MSNIKISRIYKKKKSHEHNLPHSGSGDIVLLSELSPEREPVILGEGHQAHFESSMKSHSRLPSNILEECLETSSKKICLPKTMSRVESNAVIKTLPL